MKKSLNSIGIKFLVLYLFFTYCIQMILVQFLREEMSELYNSTELSVYYAFLLMVLFFIITIFLYNILPSIRKIQISESFFQIFLFLGLIISFIYFISSIDFFINYNISFRHKVRIRDASFLVKILFTLAIFIKIVVFMHLVYLLKNHHLLKIQKISLFFILIGSLLSLNSSMGIILPAIIFLMLFFSSIFYKKINIENIFILFPIIVVLLVGVVFLGLANKAGVEYAYTFFSSSDGIMKLLVKVFTRISASFMSLQVLLENHVFDINLQFETFLSSFDVFIQKIKILLPFLDTPSRDIISVNRTNFLLLFKPFNDHAGTSPGLLGSIFYLPFFPISIIFISFYTLIIIKSINRYFKDIKEYNILTVFCVLYCLFTFFESPLSILSILLPVNFALLIFVIGSFISFNRRKIYAKKDN